MMTESELTALFSKPQELVRIPDGRRFNIWRSGQGSPAVVIAPGFMAVTADWHRVQPRLAEVTQVVSYDHAGQGYSDPGPLPRTPERNSADLKILLRSAGIDPPYVMVGVSMGGFEARHFARDNPDVAGMVLVDPSIDDARERMLRATPGNQTWFGAYVDYMRNCETAAIAGDLQPGSAMYEAARFRRQEFSDALNACYHDMSLRESYWRSIMSEYETFVADRADWSLGDMPLIALSASERDRAPALSAAEAEAVDQLWDQSIADIARQSSRGVVRVVRSKHHIAMDQPQAVIDAVLEVVAAVRAR